MCIRDSRLGCEQGADRLFSEAEAGGGADHAGEFVQGGGVGIEADQFAEEGAEGEVLGVFGGEAELIDDVFELGFEVCLLYTSRCV